MREREATKTSTRSNGSVLSLEQSEQLMRRSGETPEISLKLARLGELAGELDSKRVGDEAASLAERLTEGRFYLACIGQFKRGKSTLLNALVDDRVLPTGVVPVTTVPTVLRYGERRKARVRFEGGSWTDIAPDELRHFVSETHNPENKKGVSGVEVFLPSKLLADGMCLVDTPGLGSVFAGNTAATQAFAPHIDAAIVVVGADPPVAGEELALVEKVAREVRQFVIVLNKADRTTEAERQIAIPFTRSVLEKKIGRPVGPIFEISAYAVANQQGVRWDWDALVGELRKLAEQSGQTIVHAAGERGLRRLADELLTVTSEEREALRRPIEESERRIVTMQQTIREAERSLREFGHLFTAEQHRLSDLFLERRKEFLASTCPGARKEAEAAIDDLQSQWHGPHFRRKAMRVAQTVAARHVLPWLAAEEGRAEIEYRGVAERFVDIGNEFVQKLAASKIPQLAKMPNALDSEKGFRAPSHFRFEELINVAQPPSPLRYVADIILALVGASGAIKKKALSFFEYLLEMNSSRVQSDVLDRVQESRGQLEAEIRKLLYEVTRIATTALDHARDAQANGASAVESKLAEIREAEDEIRELLSGESGGRGSRSGDGNSGR